MRFIAAIVLAVAAGLAGCAGSNFDRPVDTIKVGKSTYSDVIDEMGEPRSAGETLINDRKIKSITYTYANTGGKPSEEGVIPARSLTYFFDKDLLIGSHFVSSFLQDSTNFDDSLVPYIKKGETTRSQAILALGKPSMIKMEPLVKKTHGEAIGYLYVTTRGNVYTGFKNQAKALVLTFDESDKVLDIEFTSSGTK